MIPEKRFLNQIQQVLARLMQPLWLLDTEGTVLLPEENRSKINLPEFMEPGMPVAFEGKTFLMIGITPELILCADAQGAATHDCIVLAGAMVQSMGRGEAPIQSRYDVYRRVLRDYWRSALCVGAIAFCTGVMRSLPHEVKDFEPDLALEGGADGLDIFRRLLNAAPYMLRAGGLFACELYEGALDAAAELCRQAGLSDVRIVHDLTDRPRIVRAIVTEPKQRQ